MKDFDPQALMAAMLPFLGLPDVPEYRAGILAHLQAAHRIAAPMLAAPIDDHTEPAPVYTP